MAKSHVRPSASEVWWALPETGATTKEMTVTLGFDADGTNVYTTRVNLRLRLLEQEGRVERYSEERRGSRRDYWYPLNRPVTAVLPFYPPKETTQP